jgi:hypothetical protein
VPKSPRKTNWPIAARESAIAVGGSYEGEINAEKNQLTGTWTQLSNSIELNLKKAAAKP